MNEKVEERILIVDDDNLLCDFYAKVILSQGYSPITVGNGDLAIQELEQSSDFVLAIIDLLMPVRTGWELIEFMKNNDKYKNIPIIALTGLAASFNEFQKVEDICDAVMHKGNFELPEFISTIQSVISKDQ